MQTGDPVGNLNVPQGFGIETFSVDGAAKVPLPAGLRRWLASLALLAGATNSSKTTVGTA
ncbi:MAG: hypothetical protein AAF160_08780 [Pseudomonadota bacterium]